MPFRSHGRSVPKAAIGVNTPVVVPGLGGYSGGAGGFVLIAFRGASPRAIRDESVRTAARRVPKESGFPLPSPPTDADTRGPEKRPDDEGAGFGDW